MSGPVRHCPAIEFTWTVRPEETRIERLMADLDDGSLSAIDDQGQLWRAFFTSAGARDRALASLAEVPDGTGVRPVDVADDGWAERSQAAIGAVRIGHVVVAPPWCADQAAPDDPALQRLIIINPSTGFGTGHHASTRRCLSLLQALPLGGRSVIDVGTGSGVLALAAWALGAAVVEALDADADALASARDNLARNGAAGVIRLMESTLEAFDARPGGYDVVVANLTGATLTRHADALSAIGRPGGSLIASGIEEHEADAVAAALSAAGWQETGRELEDGWVGLLLVRAATSPTGSTES